jgi:hypothetical protein
MVGAALYTAELCKSGTLCIPQDIPDSLLPLHEECAKIHGRFTGTRPRIPRPKILQIPILPDRSAKEKRGPMGPAAYHPIARSGALPRNALPRRLCLPVTKSVKVRQWTGGAGIQWVTRQSLVTSSPRALFSQGAVIPGRCYPRALFQFAFRSTIPNRWLADIHCFPMCRCTERTHD